MLKPTGPQTPIRLSIESLRRIEKLCSRYERAQCAEDRQLSRLIDEAWNDPEREQLIRELIGLELELKQERGEAVALSDYQFLEQSHEFAIAEQVFAEFESDDRSSEMRSTRYQFIEQVGRGGLGEIWRVHDSHTMRPLAIKLLRPGLRQQAEAIARLRREAILTGTLQHPGIPPIYEHGELENGDAFFTMKLIQGQTLEELLSAAGGPRRQSLHMLKYLEQVAQTLAYAHDQNIVHRDLKPQNIMIGRFGEVQVMDWGMAKRLDQTEAPAMVVDSDQVDTNQDTKDRAKLTLAGDILGTPGYMSPEQARGELEAIDKRTDVFGLGAILYQVLTGQKLSDHSRSDRVIVERAAGAMQPALDKLGTIKSNQTLVDLCRRCLSAEKENRLNDAKEFAAAITTHLSAVQDRLSQLEIERSTEHVRQTEVRRRQRVLLASTMVIAILSASGMAIFAWQRNSLLLAVAAESEAKRRAVVETKTTLEINEFLELILTAARPEKAGSDITLREVLDDVTPMIDGRFSQNPKVESSIRSLIGGTYRRLGDKEFSAEQFRLALNAAERAEPPDLSDILYIKDRLAGAYRSSGDPQSLELAAALREEVLETREATLDPLDDSLLSAMNNLALVYVYQNRYDDAATLYEALLKKRQEQADPDVMEFAILLSNIAELKWKQGNFDIAEAHYKRFDKIYQDNDFEHDDRYSNAWSGYAEMLITQERFEEAKDALRKSLQVRRSYMGESNLYTLSSRRKLIRLLTEQKDYEAALLELEPCLAIHQEVYGVAAGMTFEIRKYYTPVLRGLGRDEELEAMLRESVEILETNRGADHKYTLEAKEDLKELDSR